MNQTGSRGHVPMVLHIDGDNFFVSCEVARMAHLYGKPVVVGAERGIATAINPAAKKLGVTRGMPVFQIKREFPSVTILPAHFELYEKYSDNLYALLIERLPIVERYSIDECFAVVMTPVDVTHDETYLNDYLLELKTYINTALGITYSFGLGPTKSLAKLASKLNKPNGHAVIINDLDTIKTVLKTIPIGSVWGIGRKLSERLLRMNVQTAADFIATDPEYLRRTFARPVLELWYELRGQTCMKVTPIRNDYKSMQSTQQFEKTNDREFIAAEMSRHCEIIASRMRAHDYVASKFSVFVKYQIGEKRLYKTADFELDHMTNDSALIITAAVRAVQAVINDQTHYKATGITVSNIHAQTDVQMDLFGTKIQHDEHNTGSVIDSINNRFGNRTIMNASSLHSYNIRTRTNHVRNTINRYEYGLPLPYLGEVR